MDLKEPPKRDPNPQGRLKKKTPFKLKLGSPSPMYNRDPMKSRLGCGSSSPTPLRATPSVGMACPTG
jgi:hypothetical protein